MSEKKLKCPSSYPEGINAQVFAVVVGSAESPEVKYLKKSVAVTKDLLDSTSPVSPTEVFRFSSQCAEEKCGHFNQSSSQCTLAERTIELVKPESLELVACTIRKTCVWWNQQGKPACLRCPQVVRDGYPMTKKNRRISTPPEFQKSNA